MSVEDRRRAPLVHRVRACGDRAEAREVEGQRDNAARQYARGLFDGGERRGRRSVREQSFSRADDDRVLEQPVDIDESRLVQRLHEFPAAVNLEFLAGKLLEAAYLVGQVTA